jgi:uncharacterized membrane protein
MSNELWTILLGASPIVEIRGAIPIAITVFNFLPLKAYFLSLLGNLLPIIPLLIFLNKFSGYLMRHSYYIHQFLTWLFEKTRREHTKKFEIWGSLALFAFTAIPLPLTGAWSACVAAFVFGIDFGKAVACISFGAAAAGLIILGLTVGINGFIY